MYSSIIVWIETNRDHSPFVKCVSVKWFIDSLIEIAKTSTVGYGILMNICVNQYGYDLKSTLSDFNKILIGLVNNILRYNNRTT